MREDRSTDSRARFGVVFLLVLVVAAAGVVLGLLIAPRAIPEGLQPEADRATVGVEVVDFDDPIQVSVAPAVSEGPVLALPRAGLLTESRCDVGESLESGEAVGSIDGVPVLGLHSAVPFYRDLRVGDRGDDVDALETELRRLGYRDVVADDLYGTSTAAAVADLFPASTSSSSGRLSLGDLVWLPDEEIVVASCELRLGARVSTGELLLRGERRLVGLELGSLPDSAVPGDRVLEIGSTRIPLTPSLEIVSDAELDVLVREPVARSALLVAEPQPMIGTIRLAEALHAALVPPSSVVVVGGRACVRDDAGRARDVTVVSSTLGSSVLIFDDQAPAGIMLRPDRSAGCG